MNDPNQIALPATIVIARHFSLRCLCLYIFISYFISSTSIFIFRLPKLNMPKENSYRIFRYRYNGEKTGERERRGQSNMGKRKLQDLVLSLDFPLTSPRFRGHQKFRMRIVMENEYAAKSARQKNNKFAANERTEPLQWEKRIAGNGARGPESERKREETNKAMNRI